MDVYSQITSALHRPSTSTITANSFPNEVVLGPRFVGPSAPTGLRLHELHRREMLSESTPRHHSTPLRPIPLDVMDFEDQEKIGMVDCRREYHVDCIKKWLNVKNNCLICKSKALS
nr:hypothetical protein [Tanacetum cinerariifolium]